MIIKALERSNAITVWFEGVPITIESVTSEGEGAMGKGPRGTSLIKYFMFTMAIIKTRARRPTS